MEASPKARELGPAAEQWAQSELQRRGYRIVAANWRCSAGEIDIVARHGEDLVIVEVKARVGDAFGGPELAVGPRKQRILSRMMDQYLYAHDLTDINCRFDVVALVMDADGGLQDFELFEDAFDHVG